MTGTEDEPRNRESFPRGPYGNDEYMLALMLAGNTYAARVAAVHELALLTYHLEFPGSSPIAKAMRVFEEEEPNLTAVEQQVFRKAKIDLAHALEGAPSEVHLSINDPHVSSLFARMIRVLGRHTLAPSRAALLRRSLLTLAVSDLEMHIGAVATAVMKELPQLVAASEATLTLSQLKDFGTVENAIEYIIERRAEDLLRGDLSDWEGWFGKLSVKLRDMTDDWAVFAEAFARRNLVVHNDCRVNRNYLIRTKELGLKSDHLVGDTVEVDATYLKGALSRLCAMGLLLVAGGLLQVRPKESYQVLSWLLGRAQACVDDDRDFRCGLIVASTVLRASRGRLKRDLELDYRKLRWVSMRELEGPNVLRQEVEDWDVSGLEPYYAHVRHALLGRRTEVLQELPAMLAAGKVTRFDLMRDPLYAPYRDDRDFQELTSPPQLDS